MSPLKAIWENAKGLGTRVQYLSNNSIPAANNLRSIFTIPKVCLVFLNTFASEEWDRIESELDWDSTLVVENVARMCPNRIVVVHSGGVNTRPRPNNESVTAILAAHIPGQESGKSINDILWQGEPVWQAPTHDPPGPEG